MSGHPYYKVTSSMQKEWSYERGTTGHQPNNGKILDFKIYHNIK
jgi:hypothetical protein